MIKNSHRIGIDARLWNETGVGRYIRNLVTELQKIDKEDEYVLFIHSQDLSNVQPSMFNSKWSIVTSDIPWHSLKEQLEFSKILEKEKLDLVHFPYFSVPIRYRRKYVITIHDLILHHFLTGKASTRPSVVYWLKHFSYRYIISRASKNAEKIITVSNATEKEIIDHLHVPREKIVVTYEGVDEKISNIKYPISQPKADRPLDENTKYFLYVGNAYPHKNLERLIQAFAQMINDKGLMMNDLKLILVGKEDFFYQRVKEKVKQMGLENAILFKHNVSDEELNAYYVHALALIAPSVMEGFGLPILEAMAKECLVVASDIPVFREIALDIPIYFQASDTQELADVLESIAKGRIKNAKERKAKGKAQAKKFSWHKTAQETFQIYKNCLSV